MKKYILNKNTGTLHIENYCAHAQKSLYKAAAFETEQEAFQHAGKHVKLCKLCERKKEEFLHNQK